MRCYEHDREQQLKTIDQNNFSLYYDALAGRSTLDDLPTGLTYLPLSRQEECQFPLHSPPDPELPLCPQLSLQPVYVRLTRGHDGLQPVQ